MATNEAQEKLDRLLSRKDIERETDGGITERYLALAALTGEGPKMLRLSRRMVRYRESDFNAWLESRCVASTSQEVA